MALHNPLGDGQPQARPAGFAVPGLVGAVEALEDMGDGVAGDADALVLDGEADVAGGLYFRLLSIRMRSSCFISPGSAYTLTGSSPQRGRKVRSG